MADSSFQKNAKALIACNSYYTQPTLPYYITINPHCYM